MTLHAEINKKWMHMLELSDYQDSDARKKSMVWFVNTFPLSTFRQRPRLKIPSLQLRRMKSFIIEMKNCKWHYLEYRKVNIPMQGTKSTLITIRKFFITKKLFIDTLMEEMKPVVMGNKWGWVWMSRKKIFERFFSGDFALSGLWCHEQKQRFFISIPLVECYFLNDFLMEQFQLVVAEENKFENGAKKSIFLEVSDCQDTDSSITNRQFSHQKPLYD